MNPTAGEARQNDIAGDLHRFSGVASTTLIFGSSEISATSVLIGSAGRSSTYTSGNSSSSKIGTFMKSLACSACMQDWLGFFMDLRFLLVSGSLGRLYSIEFVFSMMMMLFDFSRFEFEIRLRLWRVLSMASKRGFTIETFLPLILMNRSSSD